MSKILFEDNRTRAPLPGVVETHSEMTARKILLAQLRKRQAPFTPVLRKNQKVMEKIINTATPPDRVVYFEISRRQGKTFMFLKAAIGYANSDPGKFIRYAGPTLEMLNEMIMPVWREMLPFIAEPYRPKWVQSRGLFQFPNGSRMKFGSCDRINSLRGSEANLVVIDEAGFVANLQYFIVDIFFPMFQLKPRQKNGPGGKILIGTTPSKIPNHYSATLATRKESENDGSFLRKTIEDRDDIDDEEMASIIASCGGVHTESYQREYLCRRVIDRTKTVLAEFHDHEHEIVTDKFPRRPPVFDAYSVGDVGFSRDGTGVLFAYYDYKRATIFIEDELFEFQIQTKALGQKIAEKEQELGFDGKIYRRELDTIPRVISDINNYDYDDLALPLSTPGSKLSVGYFSAVPIAPKEARLQKLKLWVTSGRIKIHKRCKILIQQAKLAFWDKDFRDLARHEEYGHFDLFMAFLYLIDRIDPVSNPVPEHYGLSRETHHFPASNDSSGGLWNGDQSGGDLGYSDSDSWADDLSV